MATFLKVDLFSTRSILERLIQAKFSKSLLCVITKLGTNAEQEQLRLLNIINKKNLQKYPESNYIFVELVDVDEAIKLCDTLQSPTQVWYNGKVIHSNEKI